jgi:uncharacterized damage-inducible protein DinB
MPASASFLAHAAMMARYNTWMNDKVYAVAARLPDEEVMRERGAFFGSIFGTLMHLVVADTIWLRRFALLPARRAVHGAALAPLLDVPTPQRLDAQPYSDLPALTARRRELDAIIEAWATTLGEDDLSSVLHYTDTRGQPFARELMPLLMHFFNHQTHHRGQATTLLSQAGQDVGVTDLLALIPVR